MTTTCKFALSTVLASLAAMAMALGAAGPAHAEPGAASATTELTITVTGLKPKGTLRLGLFASQADYEAGRSISGAQPNVTADSVTFVLSDLAPGTYAIKFYHDVNDNKKMDSNPFGMPTEPYGFSNNAKGNFGPARWDKAAFELPLEGGVHTIKVN
jgi:uncharacterized protein (DUF2141 family)